MTIQRDAAGVNTQVSEMGFNHGSIEGYTTGACRCEPCKLVATGYCALAGVPMCTRLPDHPGRHSMKDKDRTLDLIVLEVQALNFSHMHREYITEIIRGYQ
jgi:hypothetical protein